MNKSMIITVCLVYAFMGIVCSNVHALQPVTKEEMRARVPALLEELNTASRGKRWHIIHNLGYSEDKRVVDTLIHIFQDERESESIRRAALDALVATKDEYKAIPFVRSLLNDKVYGMIAAVRLHKHGFGNEKIIRLIEKYALSGYPDVLYDYKLVTSSNVSHSVIVYNKDFDSVKILKKLLSHSNDYARAQAAKGLYDLNEKEIAISSAYDLLKSTDVHARYIAEGLLKRKADEQKIKEIK